MNGRAGSSEGKCHRRPPREERDSVLAEFARGADRPQAPVRERALRPGEAHAGGGKDVAQGEFGGHENEGRGRRHNEVGAPASGIVAEAVLTP